MLFFERFQYGLYLRRIDEPLYRITFQRKRRLQAAGEGPLERDPVQEHRLLAAVFDALVLDPAELRPLALALRDKVDALGRGPIERFLKRLDEVKTP